MVDFDGGKSVSSYRVNYDNGTGVYVLLQQNVLLRNYLVTGLKPGTLYSFTV